MSTILLSSLFLSLPIILGGIFHMMIVTFKLCKFAAKPVNATLFGPNKTWRGFLVMPFCALVGMWITVSLQNGFGLTLVPDLSQSPWIIMSLVLGFAYVLFELPNSYIKRRSGVAAGKLPEKNKFLFFMLDHFDSLTGCVLVYLLFLGPSPALLACLFLGPMIHILVNLGMYFVGIRKEPF
jgi:hypothetical protein